MSVALCTPERSLSFSEPDDFLRLLSPIRRSARRAFHFLDPEARDEAVQEVVAKSFAAYRSLLDRGRSHVIAAGPLARFAVAQTKAGRHLGGQLNRDDVGSLYCEYHHGISLKSLEQLDDATGAWREILIEDPSLTPADAAAIRIDFQAWLDLLSPRQRQIAEVLSIGETTQAAAKLFDVTAGRISQIRSQLQAAWEAFQSEESAVAWA